jgi:hypothetical protein
MAQQPPDPEPEPGPGGAGTPQGEGADDALRRLEERLGRASEAAERLIAEAAGTVGRAADSVGRAAASSGDAASGSTRSGGPPPAGWQIPGSSDQAGRSDLELLSRILASLRELIPPELQRRLADALRELLMAIRALIDWYLERTERKRAEPGEVQDIPIL